MPGKDYQDIQDVVAARLIEGLSAMIWDNDRMTLGLVAGTYRG